VITLTDKLVCQRYDARPENWPERRDDEPVAS
jgi:hypothetical protein